MPDPIPYAMPVLNFGAYAAGAVTRTLNALQGIGCANSGCPWQPLALAATVALQFGVGQRMVVAHD